MPKITTKQVRKTTRKVKPTVPDVDHELAEHLKQAEHHLIEAIKLFSRPRNPQREAWYLERLERAQIAVTGLYRAELLRIRGPLKAPRSRRGGK